MAGEDEVITALGQEHRRRVENMKTLLTSYAAEIGNWMRANAKWEDRTGNARASLGGVTAFSDDMLMLILQGGPPSYVKFLELAMAGKYAVIRPALEHFAGPLFRDLKRAWEGA